MVMSSSFTHLRMPLTDTVAIPNAFHSSEFMEGQSTVPWTTTNSHPGCKPVVTCTRSPQQQPAATPVGPQPWQQLENNSTICRPIRRLSQAPGSAPGMFQTSQSPRPHAAGRPCHHHMGHKHWGGAFGNPGRLGNPTPRNCHTSHHACRPQPPAMSNCRTASSGGTDNRMPAGHTLSGGVVRWLLSTVIQQSCWWMRMGTSRKSQVASHADHTAHTANLAKWWASNQVASAGKHALPAHCHHNQTHHTQCHTIHPGQRSHLN